jgi:hypothetical protein
MADTAADVRVAAAAETGIAGRRDDRGAATGDLTALLSGGAARISLRHHPTFGINSLCHPPPGTGSMVARSTSLHSSAI